MERIILHSDMNNFYASVEYLYNPSLQDKPLAVGRQADSRYGIYLLKIIKQRNIKSGQEML